MYRIEDLHPGMILLMLPPAHEPPWDRWLDDAIAWSSGPFVHAALVGEGELIEQLATVQTSPLDKYTAEGWAYTVDGATPRQIQGAIQWAKAHLGQSYGVKALLEDGLMLDAHDWHLLSANPRRVTCSGLIERAFRCGAHWPLSECPLPSPTQLAFSPRLLGARPWQRG